MGAKLPVLLAEIEKIKPQTYIEIGCYQCDTMKEVAKLGVPRLIGFDLFEQAPEHEEAPLDGLPVTWEEAQTFGFELYRGDTNETARSRQTCKMPRLPGHKDPPCTTKLFG